LFAQLSVADAPNSRGESPYAAFEADLAANRPATVLFRSPRSFWRPARQQGRPRISAS